MNRIQDLREERGLSLQQLSKAIEQQTGTKISKASLSNYEREDQQPKKATWQILADFFNVNLSYIMGLSSTRNKVDEHLYKTTISRLVELTSGNYKNASKIRKIVRSLTLLLEETKNNEKYLGYLDKLITSITTINPYPDNDNIVIDSSTGKALTPFESARLINDYRLNIDEASNYFISVALKQLDSNQRHRERHEVVEELPYNEFIKSSNSSTYHQDVKKQLLNEVDKLKESQSPKMDFSNLEKRRKSFENKTNIIDDENFKNFKPE